MAANDCLDAVRNAAKGKLTDDEVEAVFTAVDRKKARLEAEGKIDGLNERLIEAAKEEGEKVRVLAALQRKHAALNAIARDKIDTHVSNLMAQGKTPYQAVLAIMEGTKGVKGARVSVAATKLAYEGKFVGRLLAELAQEKPHLMGMIADEKFNQDIVREMFELREGGKPGVTKNGDAQFVARAFSKHAEISRVRMNELGALIGKLDGWAGPQVHASDKMLRAGEDAWIASVLPKLDVARSFPDHVGDPAELRKILHNIYENIVTGQDREIGPRAKGEFVGPANLAKKQGEHRVLHFKDADAWLAYHAEFGDGHVFSSMLHHQRRAAQIVAQMEVFGPNPAVMLAAVVEDLRLNIRNDATLNATEKAKRLKKLTFNQPGAPGGQISNAYMEMSGLTSAPDSAGMTMAKIGAAIRSHMAVTKLGGAVLSAAGTDPVMAGLAGMFRGSGFWKSFTHQLGMFLEGRPKGEQQFIAYQLGEGFDGIISRSMQSFHIQDAPPGMMASLAEKMFRWSGMTWITDNGRARHVRMIASELGYHAKTEHAKLPARYRHVLAAHNIGEKQWNAIRSLAWKAENGNMYVTPDRAGGLSDEAVAPLIADRLALLAPEKRTEKVIAQYQAEARRDIEMAIHRYAADEQNFGVIETDERSRRWAMQGTRPGTVTGEIARLFMQFKGFPLAFTDRVLGRAFMGGEGANWKERMTNNLPHIGALMAGMTLAGYASMTLKDVAKGYWPPREPNWKTLLAAMKQGGGAGIYGDFLFGEANRFGNPVLETVAGPAVSDIAKFVKMIQGATQGEARAKEAMELIVGQAPFVNLWYTRAALDTLFLNSMRETLSPGFLHRQEERRRREYGQHRMIPATAF